MTASLSVQVPLFRTISLDVSLRKELTHLAQREQNPLEESGGFVYTLLERHVRLHAQPVPLSCNLFPHLAQEDLLVELQAHLRVQITGKDLGRGERRVRCPIFRRGEHEQGGPHGQGGEDLESFGERTRLVAREKVADFGVDLEDLRIESWWRTGSCCA